MSIIDSYIITKIEIQIKLNHLCWYNERIDQIKQFSMSNNRDSITEFTENNNNIRNV